MSKKDSWAVVKAKIAAAYQCTSFTNASIIISDAELELESSISTIGQYLHSFPYGNRAVLGLCIEDGNEDRSSSFNLPSINVVCRVSPQMNFLSNVFCGCLYSLGIQI
jgi:hypothetical protein